MRSIIVLVLTVALVQPAWADSAEQAKIRALEAQVSSLEARLRKLEDVNAKNAEALDFLRKVYDQQKAQQEATDREEPAPDAVFAVNIADDIKNGQVIGPANAGVTIVMAFDFADPYGHRMLPTLDEIIKDYPGKVRLVLKNMIVHTNVTDAHKVGCAAGKQKKFVEFFRAFWKQGFEEYKNTRDASLLSADNAIAIGKSIGLDEKRLRADMASAACDKLIKDDMAELTKFKVNATPTFFVNGVMSSGAQPKETFVQGQLEPRLAEVKRSKTPPAKYYDVEVMGKGSKTFKSKLDK